MVALSPISRQKTLAAVTGLLVLLSCSSLAQEDANDLGISYVIEPFDFANLTEDGEWFVNASSDSFQITPGDTPLFGRSSLRVDYFGTADNGNDDNTLDLGWISSGAPHNCDGARYLSLWYMLNSTSTLPGSQPLNVLRLRLFLLGDSYDPTASPSRYYHEIFLPSTAASDENEWQELQIQLPHGLTLMNHDDGDPILRLNRLRGWEIQLVMVPSLVAEENTTIWFDQLACVGSGNLLGAPFRQSPLQWEDAIDEGIWRTEYYNSNYSETNTAIAFHEETSSIYWNYSIQQTEGWGGYSAIEFEAPGNGYYNLSSAWGLSFDYTIHQPLSVPERAHLRLQLFDQSDYTNDLDSYERWYSFNYVLDHNQSTPERETLPLVGSVEGGIAPFWLTGWRGKLGNTQLDREHLKGFILELSLDSQGEQGSTAHGVIEISNLLAILSNQNSTNSTATDDDTRFVEEPDLIFDINLQEGTSLRRREFLGNQCPETCAANPTCLYAMSDGRDCYTASMLTPRLVSIANTYESRRDTVVFWMDDERRRGDFCSLCSCDEEDRSIDCSGRDLKILPRAFGQDYNWRPRSLDLRNNSNLVILGSGALDEIADSLEELWLPKDMVYMSPDLLKPLEKLSTIHREDESYRASNVISNASEAFSDVCCSPGSSMGVESPPGGISFCDMQVKLPGSDSTFQPFINFFDATLVRTIRPSSSFFSEASESPELCAEYCTLFNDCQYFSYDGRVKNSEHICYLQGDNGTQLNVCCEADHYADEDQTSPGWVSGYPPRTRFHLENARVVVAPQNLVADTSSSYEVTYELSLGSRPTRGAVWVEPTIASQTRFNVSFQPTRIVLYDADTSAAVTVRVSVESADDGDSLSQQLLVHNKVMSCDVAFMKSMDDVLASQTTVVINLQLPPPQSESDGFNMALVLAVILSSVIIVVAAVFLFYEKKRRAEEAIWKIQRGELVFEEPPVIVGRGSFGLVLRAEYRGTMVAVKRVIPPRDRGRCTGSSSGGSIIESSSRKFDPSDRIGSNDSSLSASVLRRRSTGSGFLSFIPGGASDAQWKQRKDEFMSEIRHLSSLRHPNVTTILGAAIGKREPLMVMELMHHGSLFDLLHNETLVLDSDILLPLLQDMSQGMRFLHSSNVIHGDLKSPNILVDRNFRAKIGDFGMQAKQKEATGTPFWMAPELLRGEQLNSTKTDVYSFGIILYEVFSREEPYYDAGASMDEVLRLVADKTVDKRPGIPKDMPASMQSFMTDCWVSDPDKRPTFIELDQRLKRVDEKSLETAQERRKRRASVSLNDMFPKHIAEALSEGKTIEAEHRDVVTIFFSDIVGFTNISSTLPPQKVANMLDRLYSQLDDLSHTHDIYKVETIGDAYMAVSNLEKDQPDDHAKRIAEFAIDALAAANRVEIDPENPELGTVQLRCGFHSGPVVADVVGTRNLRYCLFGDTVNCASRMESNGIKGRIHCSSASAELLELQCPAMPLCSRGEIDVKGKGIMSTYWVNEKGRRPTEVNQSTMSMSDDSVYKVQYFADSFAEEHETTKSPHQESRLLPSSWHLPTSRLPRKGQLLRHKSAMDVLTTTPEMPVLQV